MRTHPPRSLGGKEHFLVIPKVAMLAVWLCVNVCPVGQSLPLFGLDWNISTTTGWLAMKFLTDFGNPLTFHLTPSSGQSSHILWSHKTPTKWIGTNIWYTHSCSLDDESCWLWWSADFSSSIRFFKVWHCRLLSDNPSSTPTPLLLTGHSGTQLAMYLCTDNYHWITLILQKT